jgi:heat shock protein beta
VVDLLRGIEAKDKAAYRDIWKNFGRYIKLGVVEDRDVSKDLQPLLRFSSTHSNDDRAENSLLDYIARMQPGQKYIYYASAETRAAAEMSPVLEAIRKRGMEVLFATDPLDELALQAIGSYQGKDIVDIGKERPDDMTEEERQKKDEASRELEELIAWLYRVLHDRVSRVETSPRLVSAPAAIVQSEHGLSPTMQRFWEAQMADAAPAAMKSLMNQPVLEINPSHPVITRLNATVHASPDSAEALDMANLLWDVACLTVSACTRFGLFAVLLFR